MLALKWTLWTDHGFVLLMVTWAGLCQESGCGLHWDGLAIYTLEAENVPVLAHMN